MKKFLSVVSHIVQWIAAVFCILFAIVAFTSGGVAGGIILLIAALIVSPLIEKTPVADLKIPKLLAIQCGVAFVLFVAGVIVTPTDKNNKKTTEESSIITEIQSITQEETITSETEVPTTEETIVSETEELTTETETEVPTTEEITEPETEEQTSAPTESVPHRENSIGTSNKDINDLQLEFYDKVKNDVTGSWKCLIIPSAINIQDYALSIYNQYYGDSKILVIENLGNRTCTVMTDFGEFLDITVHEYIDGEENDAKLMAGGDWLEQYWIYKDNGDIEKIE